MQLSLSRFPDHPSRSKLRGIHLKIKPLSNEKINPSSLIGRTILKPPRDCSEVATNNKFICCKNKVNLFGIPLEVDGLPFQTRDPAVAACATMALWVANNKATELFQAQLHSPFEITKKAIELIENSRNLPPEGLTIRQMLAFIRNIGLDYNIINVPAHDNLSHLPKYKNLVKDAIKAFIKGNIPLVADLWLLDAEDRPAADAHSVVISGYEENDVGEIQKIYIHDDRIGPYYPITSKTDTIDFQIWDFQNGDDGTRTPSNIFYNKIKLNYLIIPIYTKIRLDFNTIYANYINGVRYQKSEGMPDGREYFIYFSTVQNYKNNLLNKDFINKSKIMRSSMPRFLWIIGTKEKGYVVREDIYDATSHYLKEIETINYNPISD